MAFGYFIDLTTAMLGDFRLTSYPAQFAFLLSGCVVLGVGVYLEVLPNVAMLPGESFVRAVCTTWKREFGASKIAFDVSMTVLAAVLSVVLAGVREGTVVAALLVGFIARQLNKRLRDLPSRLFAAAPVHS